MLRLYMSWADYKNNNNNRKLLTKTFSTQYSTDIDFPKMSMVYECPVKIYMSVGCGYVLHCYSDLWISQQLHEGPFCSRYEVSTYCTQCIILIYWVYITS